MTDLIGAMIDVTTSFEERMKREQQNKELQATIQKAISQSKNSITDQEVAQDGGNTPVSCLKLKAALAGCDKLGGFMGSACKVTARSGSDCKMEL